MRRTWLSFALPPTLLVLLLWLPFGFSLHGLIEEWGVLGVFTTQGPVLFVKAHSLLEAHRLRPLTVFPHAIGFLLHRDSFDGWHWVLMATLIMKGAAASCLAALATRSPRWGVIFGLLFLLYPADTMQLSFRSQHINLSLAVLLLGAALLVRAQQQQAGWARWINITAGGACLVAAQMMYEVALMMIMLPLFVLWCRDGAGATLRSIRQNPAPTLAWIASGIVYLLYVAYASASGGESYQQSITDRHSPFSVLYHALPKLFQIAFVRALAGGWYDAWGMALGEFHSFFYVLAFGLICSVSALLFPRNEGTAPHELVETAKPRNASMRTRVAISGLLLLILGYVPYLFSGSHVLISQRTYLFASFGAALVVLALTMSLARWSKALACAAVLLLMTAGAAAQLYQFHHYLKLSEAQRKLLRTIVENFDAGAQSDKELVILDYSNQLSHVWFLRDNLDSALTYLYDRPVRMPTICLMPGSDLARADDLLRQGHCVEESDSWRFKAADPVPGLSAEPLKDVVLAKSQAVELVIDQDGNVVPDRALDAYRQQLASADTPAARRYRNILNRKPGSRNLGLFESEAARSSHRWDFGKWWSLEVPIQGNGWRPADWKPGYFQHDTATWKSQERASLLFQLMPTDKPYELTGNFDLIANPAIQDSFRIRINGVELALGWQPGYRFTAQVPSGALKPGTNVVEFVSAVDKNYYGLSARLDELEIHPVK